MRILLVSQMYPGPAAPALGSFVATLEQALADRGHELERAVVDRPGGRGRYARLALDVVGSGATLRPGRRVRTLPRPGRPSRRDRRARPARGHRARTGRRERPPQPRRCARDCATVRRARAVSRSRPGSGTASRRWCRRPGPRTRSSTAASTWSGSSCSIRPTARAGWAGARRHRLPLRRLAHRAQERAAPRARLRAARRGRARVRRRRAAAGGARGTSRYPPRRDGRARSVAAWFAAADVVCQPSLTSRSGSSTLEALASGAAGRRDPGRRAAGVRAARRRASSSTRGTTTPSRPASKRPRRCPDRTSWRGAPPRRTTSGFRRSGWRSFCVRAARDRPA